MIRLIKRSVHRHLTGALLVGIGAWLLAAIPVRAQLIVVNETFTGTSLSSGWEVGGTGYTPNLTAASGIDSAGTGWLRLTSAGTAQSTYAYDTNSFTAANATIAVKFNYAAYGGSGADGITFFLADASKTFGVGAYGGSLGYAQKTLAGGGEADLAGMNGGYIGLGIDEFGNYSNATEGRVGGIGYQQGSISIRGPGQGYAGYDYLGGTGQLETPIAFSSSSTRPTGTDARTFQVVITATNQLTVYMQAGADAPMEALYSIDLSGYARPEDLVMGFTGSTGSLANVHEIQGLSLTSQVARLWTNGGNSSTWGSSSNWDGSDGVIPAVGADILLDNHYVSSAQTIDVGSTRSIRSLQIDAPFAYTLNNGTLQFNDQDILGPSGIFVSQGHGAANHTINSAVVTDNAIEIGNTSTGTLTLAGTLATNGNAITLTGSGNTTLSGVVSGGGSITKTGTGNTTLSGDNTYSGGSTLRNGTLTVGHNNALGTGEVVIKGGILASNAGNTVSNAITLKGNAGLSNITTSGALTQNGANRTLTLSNATQAGVVNLSNDNTGRTLTLAVATGGDSTISGVIQNGGSGAGSLTKTGTGTLTLSGANTYTGTTAINAGTLRLGASNVLADASSLNIAGGTLALNGFSDKVGNLSFSNDGVLDFGTAASANTFVFGGITSQSGVLSVTNWVQGSDFLASTNSGLDVASIYFSGYGIATQDTAATALGAYGSAFVIRPDDQNWKTWLGGNATWATNSNWSPAAYPNANGQYALFTGTTASATVELRGTRTLSGLRFDNTAKSYTLTNGSNYRTLILDSPAAGGIAFVQQQSASNQTFSFSTLQLNKNTVFDVTGAGNLTINSQLTGSTNLVKDGAGAGRLVLAANNSGFSGNIFINAGTLRISNSNALGTRNATTTNIGEGATLEATNSINTAETILFAGQGVGGGGAIRNISGNNTFSGTLSFSANSRINSDAGTLTLSGNLTSSTNKELRLGGAGNIIASGAITNGTGGMLIDSTGTITFQGTSDNTYTGATTVNSGTLVLGKTGYAVAIAGNLVIGDGTGAASSATVRLNAADQIADTASVAIKSDGLFNLNGQAETIGALSGSGLIDNTSGTATTLTFGDTTSTTFSGVIRDSGGNLSLLKQGSGKITLSGANTFAGTTALTGGIIAIQHNTALGSGAVTITSGANLEVAGDLTNVANAINLNGPGTLANDGAIQSTAGTNTLSGTLTLQSASRIVADSGSTLNLTGTIAGTGRALTLGGGGEINVTGPIATGTGGTLTKEGEGYVVLSGNNTYTGATAINAGTVEIRTATGLGTGAGGATVASGATLALANNITTAETPLSLSGAGVGDAGALRSLSGSNTASGAVTLAAATTIGVDAGTLTASGVISGGAASDLTKVGAGTLTLSGTTANTFAGDLTVANGTVILAKSAGVNAAGTGALNIGDSAGAANSAVVQLNAANQINAAAAVTLASDGRLNLNSNSQTIGSLAGSGSVTLGTGNTLTVGNATDTTFSGSLTTTGTGAVTKTGTGTLTIGGTDGSNSFAAAKLNLNQGTVQLGADNILGTALNFNGGTFSVNGFNDTVSSATLTSSSVLDFNSLAGVFDLSAGIYIGGTLTINGWAGSISGGGASQLLLPGSISGALLANINFTGYGSGAQIVNGEIVPITGSIYTWKANSGGNWVTDANWNPDPAGTGVGPTGDNISVIFSSALAADGTINVGSGKTVGYMTFNDNNRYTISGSPITFSVTNGSAQINVSNSGGGTIASAVVLNDALQISQNSTDTFTISGNISGTARNLTVAGSGNTTISGNIATTSGSLTKNNEGTLTLSGTNTYTGGTTINGGTVAISADANLGGASGALTLNGGTLQNTATLTLSATRAVTVNANGGTFLTDPGTTLTFGGVLAGAGTIDKSGTGTFVTGGASANTHSGSLDLNAGTFSIAKSANVSAIGDASAVTVATGATLQFNGTGAYTAETIGSLVGAGTVTNAGTGALALTTGGTNASTLFSGTIGNTGGALSLTKTGTGTFTLSGANSYTGTTTVSQGVLRIENSAALGSTAAGTSVTSGAALELQGGIAVGAEALALAGTGVGTTGALRNVSGDNSFAGAITLSGTNTRIQSDAGLLTLTGAISGGAQNLTLGGAGNLTLTGSIGTTTGTLTKADSGYAILSGSNSFTGATAITGGTLEIRNGSALGTAAGGATVSSGATLAVSGGITSTETPLTLNGSGFGSGGALRSLSGDNTMSGAVSLATASLIGVDSNSLTLSGVVSGTSLTKIGSGTLVLSNTNTYTGGTIVNAGTVSITSDRGLGAVPGTATAGNLTLNGGTLATTYTGTLATNRGVALGSAGGTLSTASGTTLTYGGIVAGTGSLTKTGAGTLTLTGANTYTGSTILAGGTLSINADNRLGAAPTTPTANKLVFDGGTLATTASFTLDADRSIAVNSGGGTLNVATGTTLSFGGTITGPGELTLALGGTGVFNLTSDINFAGSILLSGGTFRLSDADLHVGTFRITGDTILDFTGVSNIVATNFIVDAGVHVTVNNWANGSDYFLADHWWTDPSQTVETPTDVRGDAPTDQVEFTGGGGSDNTGWVPYDDTYAQITPVPEPSTYGALFLASCLSVYGWRRWRNRAQQQS